ncbi:HEAT repeat domain-containing protein [Amycolatopsis sp. NBC_00348]|uniref:HEAT repeat domain-containing protein n=2 Tax=unclassified Amycolatopsis TaxID=2618356 RepID=UPI002E265C13
MSLSRLGRLDLVLDRAESLPSEVVVSAVVAPPRDCHPLADFIERRPAYLPALGQYFAPGNGFCDIAAHEVGTAVTGLNSPHLIIRRHAVAALGRRRLGKDVGRRVLPLLCRTIRQDPDAVVRRLAILSLLAWRIDSRHLQPDIRSNASMWPARSR